MLVSDCRTATKMGLKTPRPEGRAFYRLMSVSCAFAFGMFGYDAGVLGGVQTTEPFLSAIGNPKGPIIIPIISSSYTLGAMVMAIFLTISDLGTRYGRRFCILAGDVFVILGGILQSTSFSIAQIVVGRVMSGFGIALISATVSTYMSEVSIDKKERGPQVAIQCIYLINGVALAYWVDFGFNRLNMQVSWRLPISLQSLFCLVSFIGMFILPDTPRWYYSKGKNDKGDEVLARLWAQPVESKEVQQQRHEILEAIKLESLPGGEIKWTDWFWDRSALQNARRIRTSFLILSFQQNMGINILVYFTTVLLGNVGLSTFLQQLLAAVVNTVFAIGTWITPFIIERVGRKKTMFWTAVACTIDMALFIGMEGAPQSEGVEWAAVAFVIVFVFLIGVGWMGCPWLYGPEISPLRYRAQGNAAGTVGEWSMTFATVFGGGIALMSVSYEIWIWQLLSCLLAAIFVWFWCPETAGKSLEELDEVFFEDAKKWPRWTCREDPTQVGMVVSSSSSSDMEKAAPGKELQETIS